jgi:ABC-type glycerol-3-phosphate transport system permease component
MMKQGPVLSYFVLTVCALVCLAPFLYMVSLSLQSDAEMMSV